jgi:RNA polymerase sigma-70 factor (ECF subfamily)
MREKCSRGLSIGEVCQHVRRYVTRYSRGKQDEDDLTQETLLAVVRFLRRRGWPKNLKALATRICHRVCMDHLRRAYRERQLQPLSDTHSSAGRDSRTPLDALVFRESVELALRQHRALPRHYRLAFDLFVLRGMNADRVARILGTRPSTVRTWVFRARRLLRADAGPHR